MLPLELLPAEVDLVPEKIGGKRNLVSLSSSINSKLILTLLIEVVALYVKFSAIYIWETGFQRFIPKLLKVGESSSLWICIKNPLQVLFGILGDSKNSGKDNSDRKFYI